MPVFLVLVTVPIVLLLVLFLAALLGVKFLSDEDLDNDYEGDEPY